MTIRREQLRRHGAVTTAAGTVARQSLGAASSAFTADTTSTDFALAGVNVSVTRAYAVHLRTGFSLTGVLLNCVWAVNLHVGGTLTEQLHLIDENTGTTGIFDVCALWLPATGVFDLDVRVDEQAGGSTLTFTASATAHRQFWVEDVGPR